MNYSRICYYNYKDTYIVIILKNLENLYYVKNNEYNAYIYRNCY